MANATATKEAQLIVLGAVLNGADIEPNPMFDPCAACGEGFSDTEWNDRESSRDGREFHVGVCADEECPLESDDSDDLGPSVDELFDAMAAQGFNLETTIDGAMAYGDFFHDWLTPALWNVWRKSFAHNRCHGCGQVTDQWRSAGVCADNCGVDD
jgi:hypothetical protein